MCVENKLSILKIKSQVFNLLHIYVSWQGSIYIYKVIIKKIL